MMVTLVGQEILRGKHIREGGVTPRDWLHFIVSLLCHDIGYVRGVCQHDGNGRYVSNEQGDLVTVPDGSTDASMTPYHVSRSKVFVRERFGRARLAHFDTLVIERNIEHTRFPAAPTRRSGGTESPSCARQPGPMRGYSRPVKAASCWRPCSTSRTAACSTECSNASTSAPVRSARSFHWTRSRSCWARIGGAGHQRTGVLRPAVDRVPGQVERALHELGVGAGHATPGVQDRAHQARPVHRDVPHALGRHEVDRARLALRVVADEPRVLDPARPRRRPGRPRRDRGSG